MAEMKKTTKKVSQNENYVRAFYQIVKKSEGLYLTAKNARFSDTELRLIAEISAASHENKRLISTQLATKLGVTRSAVSQIVNRLEEAGAIKRVPDAIDRKIAYIEVTDETMDSYRADIKTCSDFIGRVVEKFGAEKFQQMKNLLEEFMDKMEEEKQQEAVRAQMKRR